MDTLTPKCSAPEVTDTVKGIRITPGSSPQTGQMMSDLGEPVENVLFSASPQFPCQPLTIDDVLSPSFTPAEDQQWFYMHAGFGNNKKALEAFSKENIFAYIPEETVMVHHLDGTKTPKRKPIFNSYLFVLATHAEVRAFTSRSGNGLSLPYLHFVYNRTDKNELGGCDCMTIRHKSMVNFLRLAQFDTPKVHAVSESEVRFIKDEPVIITQGVFQGIIGRVARVHNQTTVVVTLDNVVSMTTAYIPKHFMEPYVQSEENV